MKHRFFLLLALAGVATHAAGQAPTDPPTGTATGPFPASTANMTIPWTRGGNLSSPNGNNNNIFGTAFNGPIYTITNSTLRSKMNGQYAPIQQYSINGFTPAQGVNTSGYLLLGNNTPLGTGGTLYNNKGAFSLLHLNGDGASVQEQGYRPWMKTGITYTSNADMAYIGHRATAVPDRTDVVLAWSDNAASSAVGPDNLVFTFLTGNGSANNDLSGNVDGRIAMGNSLPGTFNPTARLHLHE